MKRALFVLVALLVTFISWRIVTYSGLEPDVDLGASMRPGGLVADRLPLLDVEDEHGARTAAATEPAGPGRALDGWLAECALALEARCVDVDGNPLAGVEVLVSQAGLESSGESDADGRVRIERNVAWVDWALSIESFVLGRKRRSVDLFDAGQMQVRVVARCSGYAPAETWPQVILGEVVQAGELVLYPASVVAGRVVDPSGLPVAGATVGVGVVRVAHARPGRGDLWSTVPRRIETATDDSGHFHFDDAAVGTVAIHASDAKGRRGDLRRVEVRAGEATEVEIVLTEAPPTPAPAEVVLRLEVARTLALEVVRADGAELDGFHVSVHLPPEADGPDEALGLPTFLLGTDAVGDSYASLAVARGRSGPHRVDVPRSPFLVRVSSPGSRAQVLGPFDPDRAPDLLRVELEMLPTLSGHVLRDGAPVAGARVTVCEPLRNGETWLRDGFPSRFLDAGSHTRTDREGRFVLTRDLPDGTCLRAQAPGSAPAETGPLAFDETSAPTDIEIVLARGGDLEGQVVVDAGRDPAGIIVGITRGDGFARTQRTDRTGRFRFEYLMPGAWFVHEHDSEVQPRMSTLSWRTFGPEHVWPTNTHVVEGRTTYLELDLREPPRLVLEGRALADGRALGGWSATLLADAYSMRTLERERATTMVAEDGRFDLTVHEPGVYQVSLRQDAPTEFARTIYATLRIDAPRTSWSCDFATGTLTGTAPLDGRRLHHLARTAAGTIVCAPIVPGADGRFRIEGVLAGLGAIVVEPARSAEIDRALWPVLRPIDVPPGGIAAIEVR